MPHCKCDWHETDDAVTDNAFIHKPSAARGLHGNPARTGEIFTAHIPKGKEWKRASYFENIGAAGIDKFLLTMPVKDTYIAAADGVHFNVIRNADNLPKELAAAKDLRKAKFDEIYLLPELYKSDKEHRIKFLPKGYVQPNDKKNPDAVITKDGRQYVCDFKVISSYKQLVREIGGSAEQAEYCVVKMNYENKQSVHAIQSRVYKAMRQSPSIKGVIILDKNGYVFYTTF